MVTSAKKTGKQFGLGNINNRLAEIRDAIENGLNPSVGQTNIIKIFLMGYLEVLHGVLLYKPTLFNCVAKKLFSQKDFPQLFCYSKKDEFISLVEGEIPDPFANRKYSFEKAFQIAIDVFPRSRTVRTSLEVVASTQQEAPEQRMQLIGNLEKALYSTSIYLPTVTTKILSGILAGQDLLTLPSSFSPSPSAVELELPLPDAVSVANDSLEESSDSNQVAVDEPLADESPSATIEGNAAGYAYLYLLSQTQSYIKALQQGLAEASSPEERLLRLNQTQEQLESIRQKFNDLIQSADFPEDRSELKARMSQVASPLEDTDSETIDRHLNIIQQLLRDISNYFDLPSPMNSD